MIDLEERFMIRELYRKGVSISEIARQTGRDRKTIRRAVQESFPPPTLKQASRKFSKLEPYETYLQ
jgi:transposase